MSEWTPRAGESAEEYAERVGGLPGANMKVMQVLKSQFGMSLKEAKVQFLRSKSYWRAFFVEHASEIHANKGARFGALNYIRRKNVVLGNGEQMFSMREIEELVDSIGEWPEG